MVDLSLLRLVVTYFSENSVQNKKKKKKKEHTHIYMQFECES